MPCSIKYLVHDASGTYTAVQTSTFLPVKYMISKELPKELILLAKTAFTTPLIVSWHLENEVVVMNY
jgi:hypothetical protein